MDRIVELLQDPVFWFTAVIVSLLINVTSSYVVRCLDWLFARLWRTWAAERPSDTEVRRLALQAIAAGKYPGDDFKVEEAMWAIFTLSSLLSTFGTYFSRTQWVLILTGVVSASFAIWTLWTRGTLFLVDDEMLRILKERGAPTVRPKASRGFWKSRLKWFRGLRARSGRERQR